MADNPLINGHKYSWASVEAKIAGNVNREFTEITYSTKLEPGKVRANGIRVRATTRGEAEHEGSMSMLKASANRLLAQLGAGAFRKTFLIVVNYDEFGDGGVITDTLFGCRITNAEDSPKVGTEGLMVKLDLHIMRVTYGGIDVIGDSNQD